MMQNVPSFSSLWSICYYAKKVPIPHFFAFLIDFFLSEKLPDIFKQQCVCILYYKHSFLSCKCTCFSSLDRFLKSGKQPENISMKCLYCTSTFCVGVCWFLSIFECLNRIFRIFEYFYAANLHMYKLPYILQILVQTF